MHVPVLLHSPLASIVTYNLSPPNDKSGVQRRRKEEKKKEAKRRTELQYVAGKSSRVGGWVYSESVYLALVLGSHNNEAHNRERAAHHSPPRKITLSSLP